MSWFNDPVTMNYGESYGGSVEKGVDIGTPFHTPITALYGGKVTDASYHGWGGQVGILANVPGHGSVIEYFQHLDSIDPSISVGANILPGTVLGLSGGQLSGGLHPNNPQYSSGPHTEFGFNAPWIGGIDQATDKSNFNPNFAIGDAISGKIGQGAGGILPGNIIPGLPGLPDLSNIQVSIPVLSDAEKKIVAVENIDWKNVVIRTGLIAVGIIVLLIGTWKFIE